MQPTKIVPAAMSCFGVRTGDSEWEAKSDGDKGLVYLRILWWAFGGVILFGPLGSIGGLIASSWLAGPDPNLDPWALGGLATGIILWLLVGPVSIYWGINYEIRESRRRTSTLIRPIEERLNDPPERVVARGEKVVEVINTIESSETLRKLRDIRKNDEIPFRARLIQLEELLNINPDL